MLALVLDAVRARRGAALVMLLLAALTAAVAVAAGPCSAALQRAATRARVSAATPAERTLTVRGTVALGRTPQDTMTRFQGIVAGFDAERSVVGVRYSGVLRTGDLRLPAELRAVDGFCANVTVVQGRCPTAAGDVVVTADVARRLGLTVGDTLRQDGGSGTAVVALTLVGLYTPVDPLGWYWSNLTGTGDDTATAYTTLATVAAPGGTATATFDALLPAAAFDDPAAVEAAVNHWQGGSLQVYSGAPGLAAAVTADRREVHRGLLITELQLLLFGGLAVAVAAAYAAQERRGDAARMAVRGLPRWRVLAGTAGQSLLPLTAGAGWAVPYTATAGVVVAAGAVLVVAADWPAVRADVPRLLQLVQPRRPLLTATVEVCVLAVGVAAVYQVAAEPAADVRRDTGFGLAQAAPLLVALAAGVLATRLLLAAAAAAGRSALAAGRPGPALTGLTIARRRTAYRIVPVLAAATCLLALAAQDWAGAAAARAARAAVEVGADRVLRVAPVTPQLLLAAVRAADPAGRDAMAVVVTGTVVAVDSPRLAAVTGVRLPGLRRDAPAPLQFTGSRLTLHAAGDVPSKVTFTFTAVPTGARVTAVFDVPGPPVQPPAPGCSGGCRVVSVEARPGPVELRELSADGATAVDAATFADPGRWRSTTGAAVSTVQVVQSGSLRLVPVEPAGDQPRDNRVYAVDTPMPVPAVTAGAPAGRPGAGPARVVLFGASVPVTADTVASLPRAGGDGVVVDLEYAARLAGDDGLRAGGEVWLRAGAAADLPDRLRAAGLTVVGADSTAAAAARADALAPARTLDAGLAGAAVAVLLAAVTAAVVAAVDGRRRRGELAALRRQGLTAAAARSVRRWTSVTPVLLAVPVGLFTAAGLRLVTAAPVRPFTDTWQGAAGPPGPVQPPALLLAGAAALLVFLAAAGGARR